MCKTSQPCRLRRLRQIYGSHAAYFLTLCTDGRKRVLDNEAVFGRVRDFVADSADRYGVYVDSYVLMPDHAHLIVCMVPQATTTIGEWVKAFKALSAHREFKWQAGFFDHVLRSDQSRAEKWEYIRNNPVRAGLVDEADAWPYAQRFSRMGGDEIP